MARIGLLGGSFNPAHRGHRHISLQAMRDYKASTPQGKVVCRIYTPNRWTTNDNPAVAGRFQLI